VVRKKNFKDTEHALKEFMQDMRNKNVSYDEFITLLDSVYMPEIVRKLEKITIPVSVFDNDYLSALESIVKYLHENKNLRLVEIARFINRDSRAIGVTYRHAGVKMRIKLKIRVAKFHVPLSIIASKKMSVLESVVYHLKKTYSLSYHEIAVLLRRDDRTVWTVYQRALKKL